MSKLQKETTRIAKGLLVLLLASAPIACESEEGDGLADTLEVKATLEGDAVVQGQNALLIEVVDQDGNALEGDAVTVDVIADMPAHGHGTTEDETIEALPDGGFRAFPVTLHMKGAWEVVVKAETDTDKGSVTLDFEVE